MSENTTLTDHSADLLCAALDGAEIDLRRAALALTLALLGDDPDRETSLQDLRDLPKLPTVFAS